jgi:hypothetical protein
VMKPLPAPRKSTTVAQVDFVDPAISAYLK